MKDLTFMHARLMPDRYDYVDKYFDGYHVMMYLAKGEVELYYDDVRYEITRPAFFPAYPGKKIRLYSLDKSKPWSDYFVAFRGELVEDWIERGIWPFEPVSAPTNPVKHKELLDMQIKLVKLSQSLSPLHKEQGKALLEYLLLSVLDLKSQREESPWSREVKLKINASIDQLDYKILAREMMMSIDGIRKKFKKQTGQTIHDYWIDCKVNKARELLADRTLTIKQVADIMGYKDIYYFSRQFKARTGIPPATYRRSSY